MTTIQLWQRGRVESVNPDAILFPSVMMIIFGVYHYVI